MSPATENNRLILYYSGAISALTLFMQHPDGFVCNPEPLPVLSSVLEPCEKDDDASGFSHDELLAKVSETLALPQEMLQAVSGFKERVEVPGGIINVYLARFDVLDPPHELMFKRNCSLKSLLDLHGQSNHVEMRLLHKAYGFILGG